jgi:hypothetical protein
MTFQRCEYLTRSVKTRKATWEMTPCELREESLRLITEGCRLFELAKSKEELEIAMKKEYGC